MKRSMWHMVSKQQQLLRGDEWKGGDERGRDETAYEAYGFEINTPVRRIWS